MRGVEGLFVAAAWYTVQAPNVDTAEAMAILRGCERAATLGHR